MCMDVFLFLEIFSSEGGIQSYIQDLLKAYLCLNPNPEGKVFLLRDSPGVDNPLAGKSLEFHYLKTNSPGKDRLTLAYLLLKSLIKKEAQQVYCGHINLALVTASLCLPLGIPYTVLTYGKEVWQPLPLGKRLALAKAKEIWTISRYSRDRLCKANGINPEQVKIVPCVVDGDRFFPGPKSSLLLDKYNLRDSKVIMTVARLWSGDIYKGVDVTIRALPLILPHVPNLKYLVIGRGDDQPRLLRLAQENGVENRVIFAGFIPTADLPEYYRLADSYVMPSQEGFGIVYLEALATGIPVVAGDADGSADPLQDGLLGWRVPHRDPQAVAKACLEIFQGRDPRCRGEWLREQTLAKYQLNPLR